MACAATSGATADEDCTDGARVLSESYDMRLDASLEPNGVVGANEPTDVDSRPVAYPEVDLALDTLGSNMA